MEGYIAVAIFLVVFGGYVALAVGVGIYASNRGWSFIIFFLLALFNPLLTFFAVVVLDALMGAADADSLAEGAKDLTDKGKQALQKQGLDEEVPDSPAGPTSTDVSSTQRSPEPPPEAESSVEESSVEEPFADDPVDPDDSSTTEDAAAPDEPLPPDEPSSPEEPSPSEDPGSSDEPVAPEELASLDESYDEETSDREEEGKVRCDTCYSFVDESASECPACGADLDSGGFF